jgi:NAD(P)-dependent dehydrogenase (short-subunit alcohol dehydrogenase family)
MILGRDLLKRSHFHINLLDMASLYGLYAQFLTMPLPKGPFTEQIIIVTGSNSGIGLEAARHYVRLDAKKVILAVRNMESGNAVKKSIEESTQRLDVVEVWNLDMSRSASVREFSQRVTRELPRLDVAALNAGVATKDWELSPDGYEQTLQVNVISTALLAVLLLPKLCATADEYGVTPRMSIVSSGLHEIAGLPKMPKDANVIEWLNTEKNFNKKWGYYQVSKLLEIFYFQELAKHIPQAKSGQTKVILNMIDPGLCHSNLLRHSDSFGFRVFKCLFARTPEVGGRTIANGGELNNFETHGKYLSNCTVFP